MATNVPCGTLCLVLGLLVVQQVTAPPPLFVELQAQRQEDLKSITGADRHDHQFSVDTDPSSTRYSNTGQFDVNDDLLEDDLYLDPKLGAQMDIEHDGLDKTVKETGRYSNPELLETQSDGLFRGNGPIDLDSLEEGLYVVEEFEPLSVPSNFSQYDIDGDGYIDLEELMVATQAQENAALALQATDLDGDGRLSRKEFAAAPWVIGDDQPEQDSMTDDIDDTYDDRYNEHYHSREERGDEYRTMYTENA
ncbi:uncharacterized protein LOC117331348 [Pecten maximus]|uniref:uncharacterized protein LOC117331348 n=1 Tax=Pecten maximus TaxID=6579 RepID=UPI00145810BA|nr:uncharacterized protein LOC117331348 [Pecten maximus]